MATTQTLTSSTVSSTPIQAIETKPSKIPSGPVVATLNFYSPPSDNSIPYNYVETQPEGVPQRNFTDASHSVTINDIRTSDKTFSLNKNAFLPLSSVPPSKADFTSNDSIKQLYYPEVESLLLKSLPGSPNRVLIFDHTIRHAASGFPRAPVTRVHIDQTAKASLQRVSRHLPDEAAELLKSRVRIINVWRPLNGPVESFPLAFANSATVPDSALVGIEHRYPDRTGETAALHHTEGQEWWYWSAMQDDERLLLQCFDSESGARLPHSAFVDPRTTPDARGRESIEVRALVFG